MFGFGWESGGVIPPPVVPRRPATDALVARMTTPPSALRVAVIDQLVGTLTDAGIWAKLDVLVVLAAHDSQAALLNWKGTAYGATLVGAPVFVADRGVFTDGSDDLIDWGWSPANGIAFTQNGAMFGAWFRRGDRNAASPIGTQTGASCTLNPRSSSDALAGRINSSTISSGGTMTTGYGLTLLDRSGASAVQCYREGTAIGAVSTATSGARSSVAMGSGKAGGTFADGQFCAHLAGASLSGVEHRILADAVAAYMTAVGVAPLVQASRTLTMAAAWLLPDGDHPVGAGKGMGATGLARDPLDGCWWVANGIATAQTYAGVTPLSADMTTILGAYDVASWGLGSGYNGSMQGVAFDTSDATLWAVLKATAGGGTYLLHIARTGAPLGTPMTLPTTANGLAYDLGRDALAVLLDTAPATVRWFSKAAIDLSATGQVLTLPSSFGDHLAFDPLTGELLVSWGDNGAPGTIGRYGRSSYGGWALIGTDTLAGADAVEGVAAADGSYYLVNDGGTHPGTPVANRILRYGL